MNRRFLTAAVPAAIIAALALSACGGKTTPGASASSALASDSQQASAAESAASQLAAKCQPKGLSTDLWIAELLAKKSTRQAFISCERVPPGDGDQVGACVLSAAQAAHASTGTRAQQQATFITSLGTCVNAIGASPSVSPSASTT